MVTFSSIVLLIPYLAYDFYNQFLNTYGVTDSQMGWLLTAYAASAVPSYFIGGLGLLISSIRKSLSSHPA